MNHTYTIETIELTKNYGDFTAVNKLNLQIGEGEIFGFLGPNGAGKTTTILMLLGLTEPTSGNVLIDGLSPVKDPIKVKRITGYLPEKVGFYEDLTATQNLEYTARLNNLARNQIPDKIKDILHSVGLSDVANQQVSQFSHGMKQRLGIADVMIKDPKIIFFDEPTSGIDPKGTDEMLTLISNMAEKKITAVISSHLLHHIQKICTRVGIMDKGQLLAEGTIDLLGRNTLSNGKFQIEIHANPITTELVNIIKNIDEVIKLESDENTLIISCDEDIRPRIAKIIVDNDSLLSEMKIEEYGLEEIYMKYFRES